MKPTIKQLLQQYWGHTQFRPLQEDIILSVLDGKDTLALLPTGGGKSVCFQVPALTKEGMCLVVSPLIALMKDQVERLRSKGITAAALVSGMSRKETEGVMEKCLYGKIKFLYVSPERLSSDYFRSRVIHFPIDLIAVDEAHCISQWGYDFRPSYLAVAEIRDLIPTATILALTATATPAVQHDIQEKLHFKKEHLLKSPFERKNLAYVVLQEENKLQRAVKVIKGAGGSGIIYVRSRKRTREIAESLNKEGISASFYHAGMSMEERNSVQSSWMQGKVKVIVSTNAFGMGIDKPDVRFVIHMEIPESPEAYFQEAGRAGRDGQKSWAVLFYHPHDRVEAERRVDQEFPSVDVVRKVYTAICNHLQIPIGGGNGVSYDFDVAHFSKTYELTLQSSLSVLRILSLQGLVAYSETPALQSRLRFISSPADVYELQVKNKALDQLLKTLMRSYEGLFDEYVNIRESDLAHRSGIGLKETLERLRNLHSLGVIDYRPAKDEPQLTFLEERLDVKNLMIDPEVLTKRKERYKERLETMIGYAQNKEQCRSVFLLDYFGEKSVTRCGVCDVCLERNRLSVSDLEFKRTEDSIHQLLKTSSLPLNELIDRIHEGTPERRLKVLEWMLENGRLKMTPDDKVEINDKR